MNKNHYVAISIVLILLILCGTLTATMPAVKAYDYDYGYASNLYTTNWLQYQDNAEQTATAFDIIEDLFSQYSIWIYIYGQWYQGGPSYGEVQNWGSSAWPNDVYDQIDDDNTYHSEFSTVLHVGHGGPSGFYVHTNTPGDPYTAPPLTSYAVIRSHNEDFSAHQFVFMWVCMGLNYTIWGSPKAWNPLWWNNQDTLLYTWVGFEDASPWMCDEMAPGYIFRYWLVFFYYYALIDGNSITDALNYASQACEFSDFASSPLAEKNRYMTWWPYPPMGPTWDTGKMHVLGRPSDTCLPTDKIIIFD